MSQFRDFGEGATTAPASIQTTYDGINLDEFFSGDGVTFRTLSVEGRGMAKYATYIDNPETIHGGLYRSRWLEPRDITVRYLLKAEDNDAFRSAYNELNRLFQVEQRELTFTDEPYYYIATLTNAEDGDETTNMVVRSFTFTCADPYKYGPLKTYTMTNGRTLVDNQGTFETYPVIKGTLSRSLTALEIKSLMGGSKNIRLGIPEEVESEPFDPNELVLHDTLGTTTGWIEADTVDNGFIRGEMLSDGNTFYPDTVGHVVEGDRWQGPAVKRSLPGGTTLTNFQVDVRVELGNTEIGMTGMLEVYLLDTANNVIGKIGIEDRWPDELLSYGKARVGDSATGTFFSMEYAENSVGWVGFDGIIRLSRENDVWTAYYALVDAQGNHNWVRGGDGRIRYFDTAGSAGAPLAQVQLAARIYPLTEKANQRFKDVKVYRKNDIEQQPTNAIERIGRSGDTLEVNHFTNDVRVNGESMLGLKELDTEFFAIPPGSNFIETKPRNAGTFNVEFRERLL